jgi:tetratricopeptide (TPR) repeat protein
VYLRKLEVPQFKDTLAWASYYQGDYRTAVALSEEASAALPDQPSVRYHLGMSYIASGQLSKASEQLKKALQLASEAPLVEQIRSALKKAGS